MFWIAERFSKSLTIQKIFEQAIFASTDDTFALRVLEWSSNPQKYKLTGDLSQVDKDSLKRIFVNRMESRYNDQTTISDSILSKSDRAAFFHWTAYSDQARENEIQFWRRFIDNDQKRLAQVATFLFPGNELWQSSPAPFIDKLFPLDELRRLLSAIPAEPKLEEYEREALTRLERLLKGDFSTGYNPPGHPAAS